MLTFITLWPCKPGPTEAVERTPVAVTATPLATGERLLHIGALVINKRAACYSVGGFSWGTKVIKLNGRR